MQCLPENDKKKCVSPNNCRQEKRRRCQSHDGRLDGKLAAKTRFCQSRHLSSLAKEAAMCILRKKLPEFELGKEQEIPKDVLDTMIISTEEFEEALKVVRPSAMRESAGRNAQRRLGRYWRSR